MPDKKQKLELTWIGKDRQPRLEPRILIEDPEKRKGIRIMETAGRTLIIIGILVNSLVHSASGQWVQTNGPCGGSFETVTINDSLLYTNVFGRGVFRTADQGKSWTAMNDGLIKRDIFALVSLGNELFAGTEYNGIFIYSGSSGRWSPFESKSGNTYNKIFNMEVRGNEIWAATDDGLLKLYKNNGAWVDSLIHPMLLAQAFAVTDSFIFVSAGNIVERSADHGVTWAACTTGLPRSSISSLIMLDDKLGFIGTDDGAYGTKNGGDSWSIIGGGMDMGDNYFIHGFTARNDTILLLSSDRIWLSVDRGKTWSDFNTASMFQFPKQIGLIGNSVFLATSKGIFTASFSNRKWVDISAGIVSGSVGAMLKAGGTIFAGCDANGQLFRSDDNGMNWAVSDSGFDFLSTVRALTFFDSVLFAGCDNQGLVQSTDFGRTWTMVDFKTSIARSFIEMGGNLLIGQYTAGIQLLAPRGTGLQDANAGLQLQIPDCGCSAPYPTPLAFTALEGTVFAALEHHGVFSLTDSAASWLAGNSGLSDTNVNTVFAMSGIVLAGTQDKGIFRSTDRGASWNGCKTDLSGIPVSAFAGSGTTAFAGTGCGVFYSTDSGVTWKKGETAFNDSIQSLLVDGDYLLAGTATRGVWRRRIGEFLSGVVSRQLENGAKSTVVSMQQQGFSFSCRFNLARPEWVTIKLYTIQGKMIEVLKSSRVFPGEHIFKSDVRKYKSGCYVIRFEGESVCRSTPFITFRRP
jgi:photosystem II stability/assembly factor-like uncharacterized protein